MTDPKVKARGEGAGLSDDISAYDLILKAKERLLGFSEPTRFIFSHSALREGWDNPNVFAMCMLKHSDNTISRRQEVGRGLRISVDQNGDRMDHPTTVHDINILTVVASESYKDFVGGLQREIADTLSTRPHQASSEYFKGKVIETDNGTLEVSEDMAAGLEFYLIQNGYVDRKKNITDAYHSARLSNTVADLPEDLRKYALPLLGLVDSVFNGRQVADMFSDGRKPKRNPLNQNFYKKEFQELWRRINQKAVYTVEFETRDLVSKCISYLDSRLKVTALQYVVTEGMLADVVTDKKLKDGQAFKQSSIRIESAPSAHSGVTYDVLGRISDGAELTRSTVGQILTGLQPAVFSQFKSNPEQFISEAVLLIKEQKATLTIEHLTYDVVAESHKIDIFTAAEVGRDLSKAVGDLKNHVFDYAVVDSDVERRFVKDLDTSSDVIVYSKLPAGFLIPTPVGDYNPDWAIAFNQGSVKHIYFVAETKGSQPSMKFREIERKKVECARKFFDEVAQCVVENRVTYDVVEDYSRLMSIVKPTA